MTAHGELLTVKLFKASQTGSISKRLVKEFAYKLSEPIIHIFNICLNYMVFPNEWTPVTITALPKKKKKSQLKDSGKLLKDFVAQMVFDKIRANLIHINMAV